MCLLNVPFNKESVLDMTVNESLKGIEESNVHGAWVNLQPLQRLPNYGKVSSIKLGLDAYLLPMAHAYCRMKCSKKLFRLDLPCADMGNPMSARQPYCL